VVKHEHFEELCAAASLGQATAEELTALEQHAEECHGCRQAYFDYLNIASQTFAAAKQAPTLSARDFEESLNSELFARRFFDRAKREGIVFSREVDSNIKPLKPVPVLHSTRTLSQRWIIAVAAAVFVVVGSSGYFYRNRSLKDTGALPNQSRAGAANTEASVTTFDAHIRGLTAANADLRLQIDQLEGDLRKTNDQLVATAADLKTTSQDRQKLISDRDELQVKLSEAEREVDRSESMVASAQQEVTAQKAYAGDIETKLIADRVKLHDLDEELKEKSALLDQDRQLLSASHDVTDLMGARNLHIVDVVDTDPRGKSRPAFGRIFYTEGKSLIFYAYDLNDHKMQKANYQYQVWAKKEGQNQRPLRLGVFYSDDKVQRRWMFRCDDPKILREIDSVFVTFGRSDTEPSHPEGSSLMYAYLRGQPNHP
jgi:hypothetical protein